MTYNYAQINSDNICIAISSLTGQVQADNLIAIPTYDETLLGKLYADGTWQDPPQPEPQPEGPAEPQEPTIDPIEPQNPATDPTAQPQTLAPTGIEAAAEQPETTQQ